MASKKILMACSNAWTSIFQVGSHHLAREFLKMGYEIAFISDPISPLHLLGGNSLKERFRLYRSGGIREDRLWAYVPAALLPPQNKPLLRSEWVHRHWHQLTIPSVVKKVQKQGFGRVDILYLDTAMQSFWLKNIRARKTVYRMADLTAGFKKSTPALLKLEQELIQKVDLVVCTAKTLMENLKGKASARIEHLPNGVPFAHFAGTSKLPIEYQTIPKPIAIYVGAIDDWFDFALIQKLAHEMPQVSFVLIGPVKKNGLQRSKNIYLLGPRPYSEIPSYLQFASVGLIPFDIQNHPDLIHNVNPLKLYEYMASGLPVVATRWRELENIASPALLCSSFEEFKDSLCRALEERNAAAMRNFAEKLDWSHQSQQLIDFLK